MGKQKITFFIVTDEQERRDAVSDIMKTIQANFDQKNYCLNSETAHHDLERVASDVVLKFNLNRRFQTGEQVWHFVEPSPSGKPVLILKYAYTPNGEIFAHLREQKLIA